MTGLLDLLDSPPTPATVRGMTSALSHRIPASGQTGLSKKDSAYTQKILRVVERQLLASVGDLDLEEVLGPVDNVAERVAAAIPTPSKFARQIGPVYRQAALAKLWGCSRQAVFDKIAKRKLLALTTSDGVVLVPAFQFDTKLRPLKGLDSILARLNDDVVDEWTLASWLTAPQESLGKRSVIEEIRDGEDPSLVTVVVESARHRWMQ